MIADLLLDRLDGVKRRSPTTWMAKCPAHEDRTASLSVREADERVLVHCFGGCSVHDVVASIGLNIADLFEKTHDHESPHRERQPFPARDVLAAVAEDIVLVAVAADHLLKGCSLSEQDHAALLAAANRLRKAAVLAGAT